MAVGLQGPGSRFDGMTIFVTGGAGFIGSAVIRHLLADTGGYIVNIDKLTYAANLELIPQAVGHPRYAFHRVDICNGPARRSLFARYQPSAVMNLAAESHVDRSIDGPADFIQTNIVGTFTLLQEALRYWRSLEARRRALFRFLHISTDEVFLVLSVRKVTSAQTSPYTPNSPYSQVRPPLITLSGPGVKRTDCPRLRPIAPRCGHIISPKSSFHT